MPKLTTKTLARSVAATGLAMARSGLVAAAMIGAAMAPAHAMTTFDTTTTWDFSSFVSPFSNPDTATYGQTFVAPTDNILLDFTFYLRGTANLQFQAEIYAWSGNLIGGNAPQGATGPALFTSAPITFVNTLGVFVPVTVDTDELTLAAGSHYIALFTLSGPDASNFTNSTGSADFGLLLAHVANDGGGGFNFFNNGSNYAAINTQNWDSFADFGDLAWIANFTAAEVPEPATLAMFGIGLLGIAMTRRRRQLG